HLDDGRTVPCVLVEGDIDALGPLFGQRVVVGGMGVWDQDGRLQRIEADRVRGGEGEPALWAETPRPMDFTSPLPVDEPTPRPRAGAAIGVKWPGEESDEQIDEELRRIS